jgi:hypothetical protein
LPTPNPAASRRDNAGVQAWCRPRPLRKLHGEKLRPRQRLRVRELYFATRNERGLELRRILRSAPRPVAREVRGPVLPLVQREIGIRLTHRPEHRGSDDPVDQAGQRILAGRHQGQLCHLSPISGGKTARRSLNFRIRLILVCSPVASGAPAAARVVPRFVLELQQSRQARLIPIRGLAALQRSRFTAPGRRPRAHALCRSPCCRPAARVPRRPSAATNRTARP